MNKQPLSIKVSDECYEAYHYLAQCGVNSAELFRQGGETKVINHAIKFNYKLKTKHLPAFMFDKGKLVI